MDVLDDLTIAGRRRGGLRRRHCGRRCRCRAHQKLRRVWAAFASHFDGCAVSPSYLSVVMAGLGALPSSRTHRAAAGLYRSNMYVAFPFYRWPLPANARAAVLFSYLKKEKNE